MTRDDFRNRLFLQVNRDRALVGVLFAIGVIVHLEDQIRAFAQDPTDTVGEKRRRIARRPSAERAGRGEAGAAEALVAGGGIIGVELSGGAGRVEIEDAMMYDRRRRL